MTGFPPCPTANSASYWVFTTDRGSADSPFRRKKGHFAGGRVVGNLGLCQLLSCAKSEPSSLLLSQAPQNVMAKDVNHDDAINQVVFVVQRGT
jgi:hypothetical protein